MQKAILGIDIGKLSFHASLLIDDRSWSKAFSNNATGIAQILKWLNNHKVDCLHACLETTGGFEESVALELHKQGHEVSIVNPSRIKAFAHSELLRTKTDAVDAALIARFCRAQRPRLWKPPTPEIRALQALVRRHAALQEILRIESNRLGAAHLNRGVKVSLRKHVSYLNRELKLIEARISELVDEHTSLRQQRDLLTTIPGVATLTASRILAEMPDISEYRNAKAVAAFVGLSPRQHQSGTLRSRTRIVKTGNARLRTNLFFPALVAIRFNPLLSAMYQRLIGVGKPKMVAIAAVMRKLLVLAYGVLKSGTPFDPAYATL